jgi:hypothetical protein
MVFDALVRMLEQALKVVGQLPLPDRNALIDRLDRDQACEIGCEFVKLDNLRKCGPSRHCCTTPHQQRDSCQSSVG